MYSMPSEARGVAGPQACSRLHCRVRSISTKAMSSGIPWELDGPSLGFGVSDGWLPQPPQFNDFSAAAQEANGASTLHLYRRALALREEVFIEDLDIEFIELGADVIAFSRGSGVRCVVNMGDVAIPMPEGDLLLASDSAVDATTTQLAPDVAVWLR
jgi:alpha-glucosidase